MPTTCTWLSVSPRRTVGATWFLEATSSARTLCSVEAIASRLEAITTNAKLLGPRATKRKKLLVAPGITTGNNSFLLLVVRHLLLLAMHLLLLASCY